MNKKICVISNVLNEIKQLEKGWLDNVREIADYVCIVDGGSTDGTIEFLKHKGVTVVVDNIIQREGYGPARNHLRMCVREYFPDSHWTLLLDPDERILGDDIHQMKVLRDSLNDKFDVCCFPRIDWLDEGMTESDNDINIKPDYQARLCRLDSPLQFVRKLHEQIVNAKAFYMDISNPKINHFHRTAGQDKRDYVGMVCAHLHMSDVDYGDTYPMHHKEQFYRDMLKEKGL